VHLGVRLFLESLVRSRFFYFNVCRRDFLCISFGRKRGKTARKQSDSDSFRYPATRNILPISKLS